MINPGGERGCLPRFLAARALIFLLFIKSLLKIRSKISHEFLQFMFITKLLFYEHPLLIPIQSDVYLGQLNLANEEKNQWPSNNSSLLWFGYHASW